MRATAIEFRLRMFITTAIIVLGVRAPWIPNDRRVLLMEWLPLELARLHLVPFSAAVPAVLAIAAALAALGAILRVWGTAYLGPATVTHPDMKAPAVVANGPYRYVRNPLYIGLWCMVAAMALIMPPLGASLSLAVLSVFLLRLTLGEEAFLSTSLGDPYRAYLAAVPRFLPRLRNHLPHSTARPQWARALVAELTPISVLVAIVVLFWDYNVDLVGRIISAEVYPRIRELAENRSLPLDEAVRPRVLAGASISPAQYQEVLEERERRKKVFLAGLEGIDAILTPTAMTPPIPLDTVDQTSTPAISTRWVNFLDLCALALPNGLTSRGLPSSLQVVCRSGAEALSLRIGWAYENSTDWHLMSPSLRESPA